ncbi:MAG: glycosyltransferase family 2 protein [Pseudomonadota bacterium]|nr:glycosyltransferase family 2 protein [Pseudomonadota bacterium]
MFLCAVAIARNEADIIEAFIRHNLALVDRLAVVDHGSFDGTTEILAKLVQEGLPLTVIRDERVGFFQTEALTPLARNLLRVSRADFVFMLDADEFLKARSRNMLEEMLARVPDGMHALVPWVTYIPDFERNSRENPVALLESAKRLPAERELLHKVAVSRRFLETPAAFVATGNHRVFPSNEAPDAPCPHARLPQEAIAVAHVPIRSADQLTAKIAVSWLAHLAAKRDNPALMFHWGEAYATLAAGKRFSTDDLIAMAANYSVPRAEWVVADPAKWVDDPFLAAIALRYTRLAQIDAFSSVLRFAERLARG